MFFLLSTFFGVYLSHDPILPNFAAGYSSHHVPCQALRAEHLLESLNILELIQSNWIKALCNTGDLCDCCRCLINLLADRQNRASHIYTSKGQIPTATVNIQSAASTWRYTSYNDGPSLKTSRGARTPQSRVSSQLIRMLSSVMSRSRDNHWEISCDHFPQGCQGASHVDYTSHAQRGS